MPRSLKLTAGAVLATALLGAGCGSSSSDSAATSSTTAASTTTTGGGGPGGGGPGGQTFADVNLNTNGVSPGGANTAEVVKAVKAFEALLDSAQKSAVSFELSDHVSRVTWSNFPTTNVQRKGVPLRDLSTDQQAAAMNILKVALSPAGYQQVLDTQKSDDWLQANSSGGGSGFGSLLYYIAIHGSPSETEPFMVQFGGHHVARDLTYNGDKVSQTPQFVGTEPTSFDLNGTTYEPLKPESTAMFGMLTALSSDELAKAKMTSGSFTDLVMGPGKDTGVFPTSDGLLVSELNATGKKAVTEALRTYVGDLADSGAQRLLAKYEGELDKTLIGWSNNSTATGESSYIRIDGPSVWIEFINTRSQSTPNIHFHSVYRDKNNDYGSSKPS